MRCWSLLVSNGCTPFCRFDTFLRLLGDLLICLRETSGDSASCSPITVPVSRSARLWLPLGDRLIMSYCPVFLLNELVPMRRFIVELDPIDRSTRCRMGILVPFLPPTLGSTRCEVPSDKSAVLVSDGSRAPSIVLAVPIGRRRVRLRDGPSGSMRLTRRYWSSRPVMA